MPLASKEARPRSVEAAGGLLEPDEIAGTARPMMLTATSNPACNFGTYICILQYKTCSLR